LETLKLDMARETPLVQMIDEPILPLKKERLGKAIGIVMGGLIGGLLIVFYLLGGLYFNEIIINKEK
jgi:LPS O-antigen subunit length determinant protein (WzzB/FepE family)